LNVTIEEGKFSFRSEYEISAGDSIYYARKLSSFLAKLELHSQSKDGHLLAKIQSRFSFRDKYNFELSDGRVWHFECEKLLKRVFLCQCSEGSLRMYQHKGLRFSIFQNDRQIGAFSKNSVTYGKGNRYELLINDDADLIVVLCMILGFNTANEDDKEDTVTYDFGNIGPEDRPFDESWQPH
jgi:hypothetical protein